jgi:hypothetical protein
MPHPTLHHYPSHNVKSNNLAKTKRNLKDSNSIKTNKTSKPAEPTQFDPMEHSGFQHVPNIYHA